MQAYLSFIPKNSDLIFKICIYAIFLVLLHREKMGISHICSQLIDINFQLQALSPAVRQRATSYVR